MEHGRQVSNTRMVKCRGLCDRCGKGWQRGEVRNDLGQLVDGRWPFGTRNRRRIRFREAQCKFRLGHVVLGKPMELWRREVWKWVGFADMGLRDKPQLRNVVTPKLIEWWMKTWKDLKSLTPYLTIGVTYPSHFCHLVHYKVVSQRCSNFCLFDYLWVWAFIHLLIDYLGFPFWVLPWDISSPFFYWFSLSFWVGLKDFFVYSRNYSLDCCRHWKYLSPVCHLLNFYLRFLAPARGRNTLKEAQKYRKRSIFWVR